METNSLFTKTMPPEIAHVKIYFNQRGVPEKEAESFFLFYEKKGWRSKQGNFFKTWKHIAFFWIRSLINKQPLLFDKTIH